MWMKTKTKFPWGLEHPTSTFQESNIGGISPWPPPRSYTCSFCAREFPCAQALGGHMNIHRRDRARINSQPHHHPQPDDAVVLSKPILHTSNVLESYNTSKQAAGRCGDGSSKLLAGRNLNIVGMGDGDYEGIMICKKHKKNGVLSSTPLPLFRGKQASKFGDEDMMIGSRSREGLDLELRLGINPPRRAVKLESINTNVSP